MTIATPIPRFDESACVDFLLRREDEDARWESIDGIPIQMPPAAPSHARVASNLERLLSAALARMGSPYDARRECGIRHPSLSEFRSVGDVAIIDPQEETEDGDDRFYDECLLIAEVLSPSTEHDHLIELPEFGFSCRLADFYRGTSVA
jgi:Uma2 family endonuclease